MGEADTERPHRPLGPFSRCICWRREHDWGTSSFLTGGDRCRRCGTFKEPTLGKPEKAALLLAFFAGLLVGGMMVIIAVTAALLKMEGGGRITP